MVVICYPRTGAPAVASGLICQSLFWVWSPGPDNSQSGYIDFFAVLCEHATAMPMSGADGSGDGPPLAALKSMGILLTMCSAVSLQVPRYYNTLMVTMI